MIALPSQLPLLRIGQCEFAEYHCDFIVNGIRAAAARAGHEDWWIADDIARGILAYLQHRYPRTVITLGELEGKIRQTLERIGYGDIAAAIAIEPPHVTLNLCDIAREAGTMPLNFFQVIDRRVRTLSEVGVRRVHLIKTREAVKILCAAKHWSEACRTLEDDIVRYIRRRLSEDETVACELHLENS